MQILRNLRPPWYITGVQGYHRFPRMLSQVLQYSVLIVPLCQFLGKSGVTVEFNLENLYIFIFKHTVPRILL